MPRGPPSPISFPAAVSEAALALDPTEKPLKTPFRWFAIDAPADYRKRQLHWALVLALSTGLYSCSMHSTWRSSKEPLEVLSESPVESAPAPATLAHLEGHQFILTQDDNVVGSLGVIELKAGDTLSDVARHFGLGYEEIAAANPELDPWVINDRTRALVPLQFVLPKAPRRGIVINLAAMRLFHYPSANAGAQVVTYPVGIGKEGRSTPTGTMSIAQKKKHPTWRPTQSILNDHLKRGDPLPAIVPPGPDNPLGDYAMYLTAPRYLIHGTNKPYSIGLRASNGCIRLYPENIEPLFATVPVREPVTIVNQPYLIGSRGGVFFLEAYKPHEELDESAARKRIRSELKTLETDRNQSFDWKRIDQVLSDARGIPFPISSETPSIDGVLSSATPLRHPGIFFGQPQTLPENPTAWHVFAADSASEISARRVASIMLHQGPPIPAHVMLVGERYHVVAGPFGDGKTARKAARRLQVDLELESRVLAPESALADTTAPQHTMPEVAIPEAPRPDAATEDMEAGSTYPPAAPPADIPTPEASPTDTANDQQQAPPEFPAPETTSRPEETAPLEIPSETRVPGGAPDEVSAGYPEQNIPNESSRSPINSPLDLTVPNEFTEPTKNTQPDEVPLDTPPDMPPSGQEPRHPGP